MNPGRLDQRVTFRRRNVVGGVHSGPLEDFFTCWARWQPGSGRELVEVGVVSDAVEGTLTLRDTTMARQLARQDRAVFRGSDLVVVSAAIPDRSGFLVLQVARKLGGT